MSDYIDRKRAANFFCKIICGSDRGLCVSTPENCRQKRMLEFFELPAADVVPVVRCKECKFYTLLGYCLVHSQEPDRYGSGHMVAMLPDDFCSYGKRREK